MEVQTAPVDPVDDWVEEERQRNDELTAEWRREAGANRAANAEMLVYVRKGANRHQRTLTFDLRPFVEKFPDFVYRVTTEWELDMVIDGTDGVFAISGQPVDPHDPDGSIWRFNVPCEEPGRLGDDPRYASSLMEALSDTQRHITWLFDEAFGLNVKFV